ncbi:hypothetical protein SLEP1_g8879 [Rubroshorea leprosula]|uniref:Uncharacterized protein n=1 Tax=Rubroshorea leprosula TaxID=152421 RepID=A0AAV5IE33_9ROSI|nr:hypothetical protein SLEP1_g8879 [Rubroshorea leprosula]
MKFSNEVMKSIPFMEFEQGMQRRKLQAMLLFLVTPSCGNVTKRYSHDCSWEIYLSNGV